MTGSSSDHDELAVGWVAHLRDGGTTPWGRWVRRAHGDGDTTDGLDSTASDSTHSTASTGAIPGAAQLELLRRLNQLGPLPHRVDHVLSRPGPGRGPVHLELPQGGRAAPRREVLRVAAGVLADLTAELSEPKERRRRRRRRSNPPRPEDGLPRFALEGAPITVAEVRARLAAAGLPDHQPRFSWLGARPDPGPELVVVLAGPLDEALREVWSSRVQRGAARAWRRFVTQWAGRRALPPAPALDRTVGYWAPQVGVENVHVVVVTPGEDPASRVASLVGGSLTDEPADPGRGAPTPARLGPATVDVLRRVNAVLPFVCSSTDLAPRLAALVQLAGGEGSRGDQPDLPKRHRGWLGGNADRIADALQESGCPVHGDLDVLRGISPPTGHRIGGGEVLDVMVRMIHRVDTELAARPRGGRGGR